MDQQIMIGNKNNNMLRRMNKDSQTLLFKNKKPQVRIIHIFAPEIIKTDPANFRELVQRLTGKPSSTRERMVEKKKSILGNNNKSEEAADHAEIWRSSSSSGDHSEESGGFLTGFADMEDGFMQQLDYFQPTLEVLLPQNHNPFSILHHNHSHHLYTHRSTPSS